MRPRGASPLAAQPSEKSPVQKEENKVEAEQEHEDLQKIVQLKPYI